MMGAKGRLRENIQPYFWYWLHLRPLASLMSSVMFLLPIVHWHVYYYSVTFESTFCECVGCAWEDKLLAMFKTWVLLQGSTTLVLCIC